MYTWGQPCLSSPLCLEHNTYYEGAFQVELVVKNLPASAGDTRDTIRSQSLEDPLEEGVATYSGILAWRTSWTEEPSRLQFIGSQGIGHTWSDLARAHKYCKNTWIGNPVNCNVLVFGGVLSFYWIYSRIQSTSFYIQKILGHLKGTDADSVGDFSKENSSM